VKCKYIELKKLDECVKFECLCENKDLCVISSKI
jgi:hypothetical protein